MVVNRSTWDEPGSKTDPASHVTIQKYRLPLNPWIIVNQSLHRGEQGFCYFFTLKFS